MTKLLIALVILAIIAGAFYFERKRTRGMAAIASKLGYAFHNQAQKIPAELAQQEFDLFTQGGQKIRNRMDGEIQGLPVSVFDFSYQAYTAGEGSRSQPVADDQQGMETRSQSVVWLKLRQPLPDFDLSPTRIHQRTAAGRHGLSRVTFDNDREFNQDYNLLARDGVKVRALFSEHLRSRLSGQPGMVMEARGAHALFYRFEDRVSPDSVPELVRQIEALVPLLEAR